jgi:hypothetical protein
MFQLFQRNKVNRDENCKLKLGYYIKVLHVYISAETRENSL